MCHKTIATGDRKRAGRVGNMRGKISQITQKHTHIIEMETNKQPFMRWDERFREKKAKEFVNYSCRRRGRRRTRRGNRREKRKHKKRDRKRQKKDKERVKIARKQHRLVEHLPGHNAARHFRSKYWHSWLYLYRKECALGQYKIATKNVLGPS